MRLGTNGSRRTLVRQLFECISVFPDSPTLYHLHAKVTWAENCKRRERAQGTRVAPKATLVKRLRSGEEEVVVAEAEEGTLSPPEPVPVPPIPTHVVYDAVPRRRASSCIRCCSVIVVTLSANRATSWPAVYAE